MKITYDPEVDVIRIVFSNAPIEESIDDEKNAHLMEDGILTISSMAKESLI